MEFGRLLADVKSVSKQVYVLCMQMSAIPTVLRGHTGAVLALATLRDCFLLSAGSDKQLVKWDVRTLGRVQTYHCGGMGDPLSMALVGDALFLGFQV